AAFCHGAVWAGCELLRGWVITGISWNVLGTAFHDTPLMAQAADLFGVVGLSMALVFFQAAAVQAFSARRWPALGIATAVMAAIAIYGAARIRMENGKESIRLKTLLVQLNIPMEASRMLWTAEEMHMNYEDETLKGLEALKESDGTLSTKWPDWVMWPECALTGRVLFTEQGETAMWLNNHETISQIRTAGPFSLIYGVYEMEADAVGDSLVPKERGRNYNSLAISTPEDVQTTYRKRHLVIFGETIPFVDSMPFLQRIYEQQAGVEYQGAFTMGDSTEPLTARIGEREIGAIPTVCFEDSVPRLTRKFVRPGPQVIVNVTNDGWFKESAAADQHFQYARFRAIELRRPMLRSANTGVSAAIDTTGSTAHPDTGKPQIVLDEKGSHFTQGSLLTELRVPLHPGFSLYAVIGDYGLIAIALLGL
ncbi:MAG: apolipoprotein N-acyltransferase, partial [Verrucomicrobiaceae bacterium]